MTQHDTGYVPGDLCAEHPDHFMPCSRCAGYSCCGGAATSEDERLPCKPGMTHDWNGKRFTDPSTNWPATRCRHCLQLRLLP